jgi:hypothetical protein
MVWTAIIVLVVVFLAFTFLKPAPAIGGYKKVEFLSPVEKDFLKALDSAMGSKYRIFTKVRLADIITPTAGDKSSWQTRFNRINAKHVDFLLCGIVNGEPVCAIELDDRTHLANSRVERDDFLNHALQSAGIPIARFQVSRNYSGVEIEANIDSVTSKAPKAAEAPACPKCGKQMVMRKAQTGPNAGHSFWGCPGYPACKGIVNIVEYMND